tara:strand:- start:713 stop:1144 length:432 start_codon:yes stop_codon:yes gene_type:complete
MTKLSSIPAGSVLVAIDMAKNRKEVLIERPEGGRRRRMTVLAGNTAPRDRCVGDRGEALPGYVIDDVEHAEPPATGELVMDEVQAPAGIGPSLHKKRCPRANSPAPCPIREINDCSAPGSGRHQFFERRSFSAALSSIVSARP